MAHITSIRFWSDPGFTEGCIEIPGLNYVLPTASYVPIELNGWRPAKNMLFERIRIEESFPNLINMSFLEAVFSFEDESEMTFYGWIDNVSILSDDADHPTTAIDWHIDYWMTYRRNARFKYGLVRRRKNLDGIKPPQNPPYRYKEVGEIIPLMDELEFEPSLGVDGSIVWVIVNFIHEDTSLNAVTTRTTCVPIQMGSFGIWFKNDSEGPRVGSMNWYSLIKGSFDEVYGLAPSEILSIYMSPIAPFEFTGTGRYEDPLIPIPGSAWYVRSKDLTDPVENQLGWFLWEDTKKPFSTLTERSFETTVETGDVVTWTLTDFKGNAIGTLPYGFRVKDYSLRIVNTSTAGYLQIRFDEWEGGVEGLTFNIPLPSLDISSNSQSSYVYSGQKEFDAESKRLANQHAMVQGGISTVSGGLSGAVTGGLMGSLGGPLGIVGGALVGGVGQMIGGAVSTGLEYAENIRYTDELLGITAEYHANQLETMLIYGDTLDWFWYGKVPCIVSLTIDEYSRVIYTNEQTILGSKVSEPNANCQSLIEAGGPLQIENLIVGGDIPARAKDYIRDRFRRGVRLI